MFCVHRYTYVWGVHVCGGGHIYCIWHACEGQRQTSSAVLWGMSTLFPWDSVIPSGLNSWEALGSPLLGNYNCMSPGLALKICILETEHRSLCLHDYHFADGATSAGYFYSECPTKTSFTIPGCSNLIICPKSTRVHSKIGSGGVVPIFSHTHHTHYFGRASYNNEYLILFFN